MAKKAAKKTKKKQAPKIVIKNFPTENVCLTTVPQNGPEHIGAYYISHLSIRDDARDVVEDIETPAWLLSLLQQAYLHGQYCAKTDISRRLGLSTIS